jgi:hypothetical protein
MEPFFSKFLAIFLIFKVQFLHFHEVKLKKIISSNIKKQTQIFLHTNCFQGHKIVCEIFPSIEL